MLQNFLLCPSFTQSISIYIARTIGSTAGLVPRYSQKAVYLKNVARADAMYLPAPSSRIQSMVFAWDPVDDLTQTPAAFGRCGNGLLGFVGDVNAETGTDKVVLAMCGPLN